MFPIFALSACSTNIIEISTKLASKNGKPVNINTYNYDGQKIEQIKTNALTIKPNNHMSNAINLNYGQNSIVHASSCLIAYENMPNYMAKYIDLTRGQNVSYIKDEPLMANLYETFKDKWTANGNIIVIKTQSGSPVAIFSGSYLKIKDIGSSDNSNALLTLDGRKIFVYNASYTAYPVSALKAMHDNEQASKLKRSIKIKTTSVASDLTEKTSNKNKH